MNDTIIRFMAKGYLKRLAMPEIILPIIANKPENIAIMALTISFQKSTIKRIARIVIMQ